MVDSARLGAVVDESTAWASELVVECDGCGQAAEAGEDSFPQTGERAGPVALEGEQVFAGPEDRFDPLADRREVRPGSAFFLAAGAHERGLALADGGSETAAGVAAVAEQQLAAVSPAAVEQDQADF